VSIAIPIAFCALLLLLMHAPVMLDEWKLRRFRKRVACKRCKGTGVE